ncbi:hypothetical protein B0T25DRAFT_247604 [Lasiosphaeria hispida]|uniref:AAA+ ATPase domain-containing protein n=1 Tax=Lasiosphaeria hispida TaxID=260671 RepID=A0AAJ0HFJ2_9PEZI|nr:hypothetical protein B0T25DRAFT_247604 [Lasiosphaeria hispida]
MGAGDQDVDGSQPTPDQTVTVGPGVSATDATAATGNAVAATGGSEAVAISSGPAHPEAIQTVAEASTAADGNPDETKDDAEANDGNNGNDGNSGDGGNESDGAQSDSGTGSSSSLSYLSDGQASRPKRKRKYGRYNPAPPFIPSNEQAIRRTAQTLGSAQIFEAYKRRMEMEMPPRPPADGVPAHRPQAGNLVNGVVDYLRVLEQRVIALEMRGPHMAPPNPLQPPISVNPAADTAEPELAVKFYDSRHYLSEDGIYHDSHTDMFKESAYLASHGPQHFLRVLYAWVKDDSELQGPDEHNPDAEPPNPEDVDIITFGINSLPLTDFFEEELEIDLDTDYLIRLGKPFRPLIRNIDLIRGHLQKLEDKYGQVSETSEPATDLSATSPESPSKIGKDSEHENQAENHNEKGKEKEKELTTSGPETLDADASRNLATPSPAPPTAADNTEPVDSTATYDRPSAIPHFRTLLDFIDKYLGKQIQLYTRLREGKETRIAFENLWMLFESKDTIYCPLREVSGDLSSLGLSPQPPPGPPGMPPPPNSYQPLRRYTSQAYRVVATAGGMPLTHAVAKSHGSNVKDVQEVSLSNSFLDNEGKTNVDVIADILQHAQLGAISRRVRSSYSELYVYCFYVDFNGSQYGTMRDIFVFKPYEREMDIRSLTAYPVCYADNEMLQKRGKAFMDATRVSHMQYEGLTTGPNREDINSPVVLDIKLAFENDQSPGKEQILVPRLSGAPSGPWLALRYDEAHDTFGRVPGPAACFRKWCYNRRCTYNLYMDTQRRIRDKIEADAKLVLEEYESERQLGYEGLARFQDLMEKRDLIRLLPGAVPGFALRNRKWVVLDLRLLGPVEQNSEWDNLVLPAGHREMVQAMVETHTKDLSSNKDGANKIGMDLVRGKGKGCIILLHGVPGVGKTSTAECVAAHTKKPLYPITCGDIGYEPEDVEKNMENHFKLAHRWGCVLLLDEADVFLAKRDQRDVQRNGLVSVFLRILEYYSGILFLTTNRVGAIDDAFRSRLHLTLFYPKLTKKQTTKIFLRNFERISEINADRKQNGLPPFVYEDSEKKVMEWIKGNWKTLGWNGRQIRNTFQTALALAEFHSKRRLGEEASPALKKRHFEIVADASTQFNEYLKDTHGFDEDRVAKRDLVRALNFAPTSKRVYRGYERDISDSSTEDNDDSDSDQKEESETDQDSSDDSSDSDRPKKKKPSKGKKAKSKKSSKEDKKSKKSSEAKPKSEKKGKEREKEKKKDKKDKGKEKEDSDESDD